jgi:hypothetical protein
MLTYDEFEKFSLSNYALEEKIVSVIDYHGRQVQIESVSQFLSYQGCTIKIQSMEKYNSEIYKYCKYLTETKNHNGPVTCHAFRAYPDSVSFDMHKDPRLPFPYIIYYIKLKNVGPKGSLIKVDQKENLPKMGNQNMRSTN